MVWAVETINETVDAEVAELPADMYENRTAPSAGSSGPGARWNDLREHGERRRDDDGRACTENAAR
jgi:hypothetical protein